jgi:2-keto-3-deoxy-L-rhamnonate aldolase RhmA
MGGQPPGSASSDHPARETAGPGLKGRLAAGETVVGSFVNLGSSLTAEIMGLAGFDWLVVDLEHGAGDEAVLLTQLQALSHTGTSALVRVEGIDSARILHALDLGADGVLVPRLRSAQEARTCVDYCRYAGSRGVARYNRSWSWGLRTGPLAEADARVVCAVQIETAEALAAVDDIAAVEGVDVLFVGPSDLAHALRLQCPPDDPQLLRHAAAVAEAARAHGVAAGMLVGTPQQAQAYRDVGFRFIGLASDGGLLATAARSAAAQLRELAPRA